VQAALSAGKPCMFCRCCCCIARPDLFLLSQIPTQEVPLCLSGLCAALQRTTCLTPTDGEGVRCLRVVLLLRALLMLITPGFCCHVNFAQRNARRRPVLLSSTSSAACTALPATAAIAISPVVGRITRWIRRKRVACTYYN